MCIREKREEVVRGKDAELSNDSETGRIKNMNSDNKIFIKNNIYFDEQWMSENNEWMHKGSK